MKVLKKTLIAASLAAVGLVGQAQAQQTDSGQFEVNITIEATCNLLSADNIDFNTQSGIGDRDGAGQIVVECSRNHFYTLELETKDADQGARSMWHATAANEAVGYGLYLDAARTTVWGSAATGHKYDGGIGQGLSAGNAITHDVYARAALTGDELPGDYSATVYATLTF